MSLCRIFPYVSSVYFLSSVLRRVNITSPEARLMSGLTVEVNEDRTTAQMWNKYCSEALFLVHSVVYQMTLSFHAPPVKT